MQPDYKNFQAVEKGELLALDKHGEIRADEDGLILMPLYQKQGDDGFFLVRRIEY
jgi:succinylglutamate desuccinylase